MNRPKLNKEISPADFSDFYWLKEELVAFCKAQGIHSSGGKIEITKRIRLFLETGEINDTPDFPKAKSVSKFDWNHEVLTLETKITDNYKNSENVRKFLSDRIGKHFRFNVPFMKWTRQNCGKTLRDAIAEWNRIYELKKDKNTRTEIDPQFEYNRYIRAFLSDNPDMTVKDAIKYWKLKRANRGSCEYLKSDLELE